MIILRVPVVFFSILALFFLASCKKPVPTGPDLGDGTAGTLEIKATITMNGQPLANVEVYLSGKRSQKTLSSADGTFTFSGLPAGIYYVTPSQKGINFSPGYFEFSATVDNLIIIAQTAVYGTDLDSILANFSAKNQDNLDVSLYDYFGRVILLNFSADWCVPCQNEAGLLSDLFKNYEEEGFQVITLMISGSNAEWADLYSLSFPVLDDLQRAVFNLYSNGFVPLNIVIGRNCNLLYEKDGYNEAEIEEWINKFL